MVVFVAPESQKDVALETGRRIFEKAAQNLSRADGLNYINSSVLSLMDSSCCGYHRASYVLAVIFEIGLGVPVDSNQVRIGMSLLGDLRNNTANIVHLTVQILFVGWI